MGRHSRPAGEHARPPDPDPGAAADQERADPLAPYRRRRRPPDGHHRRHRPLHGRATHLHPDQPRALETWDGFAWQPAGVADTLAAAQQWASQTTGPAPDTEKDELT